MEDLNNPESEIYKIEDLNNPESEIYKRTLEEQKLYINTKMNLKKNRFFDDNIGLCGEKEIIAKHLNLGPAQNLVQNFFKYKGCDDKCLLCNGKKGNNNIRQIDRAHCNIYSRYDLLMMAIDDLYIDNNTPIKSGDILKLFIQKHEICPIYRLCKICHNKYDKICK